MAVTINVQASQTALAQSIAAGVAAYNAKFAAQNQLNLQFNPQSFSQPLGRINGDLKQFQSALAASNARVLAFGASTAVIGGVAKSFKELATATIDVEKALVDINRVLSLSSSGLQKFSTDLFGVAKATASSFKDASEAALEFSRQGLSTEQTLQRVSDALTLVRLTGVSAKQAVEDLTAVTNAYAQSSLDTTTILNKIVAVEQKFAVSAADLTSAVSRTGQAAQEAGVNFDQLNALVTATQEKTARGGAVIGNALKTIFTRLQRTETLDQLENFNVAVRDIEGNVLPAVQILQNLARTYGTLADTTKSSLAEQVAGVYQVNILKSLISDLNDQQGAYNKALEIGANATNEAQQANAALNVTLAALISQTGTNLQQLSNNIGKVTFEPVFKSLISPFNDAVTYINDLLEGEGLGSDFANGLLKGVKNVLGGPVLFGAVAIITKVIGNTFKDISTAIPTLLGITTQAQKRRDVEESILKILQTQSTTAQALIGNSGNLAAQQQVLLNLARYQTAQYQQQLDIAKQLAPLLVGKNVQVGSAGLQVGKITASGYIPSYSAGYIPPSVRSKEVRGALSGGYQPGTVVPSPVGGVMNTAESVKYVPNFVQPFINPPLNSPAGIAHRENSIRQTGINPYQARGFIPNFAGGAGLFKSWIRTQPGGEAFLASANLSDINWYRENAEAVLQLRNYLDQYNKANPEAQYSVAKLKDFDVQSQNLGKKADLEAKLGKTFTTTRRGESISGVPETPQAAPSFNAATLVTRMQSRKSFAEAYPDLQKILNDPNASEKEKNAADQIINDNLGQAYEAFGLQHLKQIGYPKAVTAESLNLAGSPKTTAIDAVDFPSQTFFEFKGGEVDPENITSKFIRARTDEGNFEKLFQGKTGKPWIETADENDRALGKAWTRDASVFDSLFKKYTSQAWQNVLVANDYGKAVKSGNKVVYFNPVDSATPGLYLMEYFKELKGIGEPYAYYKQSIAAEDIPSLLAKESERVKSFFPFQTDADFKKFIADNRGQAPQKAATAGAIAQAVQNIAKQKPSNLRPPINWVYDSDVFGGSYAEKFDNLKNIILNDPSLIKDILVAPAGAGKTTYAAKLGYKPITNFEDIHEGDRVLLLSASRLAKGGGFSTYFQQQLDAVDKTGGKKFFGELPNELITERRQIRAQSGVARGLNAPLRESDFEQMLMSQGFKSLSLASNGFIPNFAFENFEIADERQKMVLKLLNEDPSRSLQDIADNLNIAYPNRKQKITKNEVRQILGKARRFFEQGKFKDINLSTGAKNRLNNVRSDGFIPNFASENAIRTMQEIIARAEGSNDPRLINEANVAKEKLKKLTGSEGGINFLNSISDIDVPELDLQSQLNNIRVAYTDTKGEMRRGTAPLSSLEQIIQVLRQKRHKEISILGAGLPGIKERLAALGIKDSEYQVSGGYEYFPLNQFGGFIPNFSKLSVGDRRFIGYSRVSNAIKMLRSGEYADKIQDNDLLNIPKIQTEKLNVDSKDFRDASARRSKILSELSDANKKVGQAFEAGIAKKYKSLKQTSKGGSIKFGSSSALDLVDDNTLVEAKAGNYNLKNVEEKFFRFPFENINDSKYNGFLSQFSTEKDNVQLYQDKILKLITAPESIDKEYLYRTADDARYQENLKALLSNKGFIPNFANAIALNKRYEFDGKYDSLNGKKRFNDIVKANSTDNIIPAFVGPNGVFYHHSIPSHEGLVRQFGLTAYDLENSIKAFIQNGVLTIPNLEETFQMQGKLRSQSLIDYAAKSTRNHLKESGLTNIIEKTKKNEKNVFFKELPQSEVFAAFNSLKNASWNDFSEEKTYQKIESLPLDKAREIIGLLEAKMDNRIGDFVPDNNTAQAQKNFISDVARVKADLQQILQEKEKASQELKKLKGQFGIGAGFSGASSFSKGFIPNFATGYLSDVMSLESNLSNNTAVLDTTTGPYPFIRNTSQPNFAAAISDHGGEKKALKDSITNQTNAGLLKARGMIPNFAPGVPPPVAANPGQQLATLNDEYALNMDLLAETLKQLRKNLQLSDKEIKTLTKEAKNLAATLDTQEASIKQMGGAVTSVRESDKNIAEAGKRSGLQRTAGAFANLGNNIAFTLIAPLVAGQIQQVIEGNKERFEQSQTQRFASAAIGSGLSSLSTGATIGAALAPILGPLAPFGPAIGAASAAALSLASAALGASDSLEDLQKKSEKYDKQTQETVGAGKNIIDTFKSLASLDPNSLEFFDANQKLQDYFVKISETSLDQKFQKAGTDIELMTQAIKEYEMERVDEAKRLREDQQRKSRESVSIEEIGKTNLLRTQDRIEKRTMRQFVATPQQIQLYGKNVTEGQVPIGQQQFQNVTYDVNLGKEIVSQGEAGEENRRKILAQNSQLFEDLGKVESAMGTNFETFVKEFRDQANDDLRGGGYLGVFNEGYISDILNKYEIKGIDSKKFADQLQLIATESGDYGRFIVDNFDIILTGIKEGKYKTPKEAAKQLAAEVQQAQENIRQILFKNTQAIANGLTDVAIELEKYEFDKSIGKLGLEKSASLINTALGAIGKNIFDGFKAQFDLLTAQTQFQQGKQQLGFDAANFEKGLTLQLQQQRLEQQNKLIPVLREALGDNQQKNIQTFIDEFQRTGNLQSVLNLETGQLKGGEEGKRKLQDFQRTIESENRITATKQDNARKIFTSEQEYANLTLELNNKIAVEEYKLNESRYQYALKEKALLDSIQLSAQKAQIDTQAAIEALRLPAQSPYFKLGAGEFGRQDINRGIEQQVFQEQIAGQAKQAIADAQIADVQRQVLEANSAATINNTTAIEALIDSLTKTAAAEFDSQKQQIAVIDKQIENIPSSVESLESIRSRISDSALEKDPSLPEKERQATIEKERKRLQLQKEQITSSQSYARNQAAYQIQKQQIERRAAQDAAASQTVNLRDITGGIPLSQISNPVEFLKQKQIEEQQRLTDLENQRAAETDLNKRAALDKQIEAQRTAINKLDAVNYDIQQKINNEKLKQKQLDEDRLKRGKFLTGVQQGFDDIVTQSQNFEQNFGKTAVMSFRDGLTGAIDAAMNKTDDLGAALMEVASGFLRTMQQALNQQIANNLVMGIGSAFPSATGINAQSFARRRGGIIRAQDGIYVPSMAGGNGMGIQDRGRIGDVNPALLEDGEYVLNRNAVAALGGPSVLDSLNFGQFPRFANGGQNTGSLSASANFDQPFEQLSELGKAQSPEYGNYLNQLREQWEKDQAKKKQRRAFINQLIMTGVSAAFTAGLGSLSQSSLFSRSGDYASSAVGKLELGTYRTNAINQSVATSMPENLDLSTVGSPEMLRIVNGKAVMPQRGGLMRFASGGYLPYGNRLNDTIPALLSGGEYIVNSRSVRKYGVGGMNRINSGVARFEDGGLVGDPGNQNNTPGNVESSNSNNVSINITVNNNGGSSSEQESSNGGLDAQDKDNQLGQRIKQAVLQVITDEQRTGGLLDSTKKK